MRTDSAPIKGPNQKVLIHANWSKIVQDLYLLKKGTPVLPQCAKIGQNKLLY